MAHFTFTALLEISEEPEALRGKEICQVEERIWKERELQIWVGFQTYFPERAVLIMEVNLILLTGMAAGKLMETGIFFSSIVTWSQRPSFQSHKDMLIYASVSLL